MTTALDIIKRSMRLGGVYAIGEDPSAEEAADGLVCLNALVTSLPPQLVYANTLDIIPLLANTLSLTVGPSGTFPTARPIRVLDSSYVLYKGVSYSLRVLADEDYNSIALKALVGGIPTSIWPLMNMPDIKITPWPFPSADMVLYLWSEKEVFNFPTLTTVMTLPQGYERMLAYLHCVDFMPEYDREASPAVQKIAFQARKNLKRTNLRLPAMKMPYGIPSGGWNYGLYPWS